MQINKTVRILATGHCSVDGFWPAFVADYLSAPGTHAFAFVGGTKLRSGLLQSVKNWNSGRTMGWWLSSSSRQGIAGVNNDPPLEHVFHEGSGQFDVYNLLHYYDPDNPVAPGFPDRSPFVFKTGYESPTIDVSQYVREALDNVPLDYVFLNVGDNNAFMQLGPDIDDSSVEATLVKNMNELVDNFRKAAPDSVIAVLLPPLCNESERAFTLNYTGKYPRWRQLQNRARFIELMVELAKTRQDIKLVPANFFVDQIEGYPPDNALHFNARGAQQIAASIFSWLNGDVAQNSALLRKWRLTAAVPIPYAHFRTDQ